MTSQPHVLLFRPPWHNNELYFRAQQALDYFRQNSCRVTIVAGDHGWSSIKRLLSWPGRLARADIVFLYPQPLMPLFALTAKWFGRRVIIDHFVSYACLAEVSPRTGRRLSPFERAAYRQVDLVLAHTRSMTDAVQTALALPAGRVHTLYCVVDTAHFAPAYEEEALSLRHALGLDDHFVVLYHGLRHPWHGVKALRAAVSQLVEAGEPTALVLIGRHGEGADHERLLGEIPFTDLPRYIQMADVWCSGFANLPRGDRSFSSTMVQALAMARPVVTSPSPEKARFLGHNETAFFVPPGDPDALAERIRYCRLHPDDALRVGQAGRRLAQEIFDIAAFNDLLEDCVRIWFDRSPSMD